MHTSRGRDQAATDACDDDTDGISTFNLTQKNDVLSANYTNETFRYFTTLSAANTANNLFEILNPFAYTTGNTSIYVRVETVHGCSTVGRIDLIVSATQILLALRYQTPINTNATTTLMPLMTTEMVYHNLILVV